MTEAPTQTIIDVYADVVCPFTHVGLSRLVGHREAVERHDVKFHIRAWPLEIVNDEPVGRDLLTEEIAQLRETVAPDLFTAFDPDLFPMSSLSALALVAHAYELDEFKGERASLAVRDALFEEGRDVSDEAVLHAIAEELDLGSPDLGDHSQVMAEHAEGKRRGVEGSPHFFVGGDDYFCPSLDIRHVGERLEIDFDEEGFTEFVARCFSSPG